ncbi:hypothetical protein BCV70DRAFT_199884 [Testicularia cyperi]|uniref:Nuclear rim protein 1 n=1 Tax=Testicularia cyperi TaxID=1882483 RepID=A0A317XTD6_9BASI|nr:hypothetical protein BCV70DRAFT_199884 [Testicularia cyperi]
MSYPGSPGASPGSPAYRKGVAFGKPGWRASRASRGRSSWTGSPLRSESPLYTAPASARHSAAAYLQAPLHRSSRDASPLASSSLARSTSAHAQLSRFADDLKSMASNGTTADGSDVAAADLDSPSPPAVQAPRKRFVRRLPLQQRIRQWPIDTYYRLSSYLFDVEEQIFADQAGNVLGGFLHVLSFLALLLCPESSLGSWFMNKPAYRQAQNPAIAYEYLVNHAGDEFAMADALKRHARKSAVYQASDSFFRIIAYLLFLAIFAISCANAYAFFTKRRAYKFYHQSKQEEVLQQFGGTGAAASASLNGAASVSSPNMHNRQGIRELHMWDPTAYSANLFATFSPAHAAVYPAAVLVRFGPLAWLVFTFLLAAISLPVHLILQQYQQLVKDKSAIQAAVLTEYNEKYVYPKATPVVRDQATQTMW